MNLKFSKRNLLSLLPLVALMFAMSSCSNTVKNNDLADLGLQGKVKSIRRSIYNAEDKFGNIEKSGKSYRSFYVIFNKQGFIEEENQYNSDGNLDKRTLYKYDVKQNLMEKNEYDSNGNLNDKYTFKYDEKGNMIEENRCFSDGSIFSKHLPKYDNRGNVIELSEYNDNGELYFKRTSKYDKRNNMIESYGYDADGSIDYKVTLEYDAKDNLIGAIEYNSDGSINVKNKAEYKFDKTGNWIYMLSSSGDIPEFIQEREIEYF